MRGIVIAFSLLAAPAAARDFGQWEAQPPEVRQWFQRLMQPDVPTLSCCGEADAYWADSFEVVRVAMWRSSPTSARTVLSAAHTAR